MIVLISLTHDGVQEYLHSQNSIYGEYFDFYNAYFLAKYVTSSAKKDLIAEEIS